MSRHETQVSLQHMLDHARSAVRIAQGKDRRDLDRDEVLRLALTRAVEIIGEAASRVPPEYRQQHPHVPWPQIISTRHRLIHAYDKGDLDVLWSILADDLPALVGQVAALLAMMPR